MVPYSRDEAVVGPGPVPPPPSSLLPVWPLSFEHNHPPPASATVHSKLTSKKLHSAKSFKGLASVLMPQRRRRRALCEHFRKTQKWRDLTTLGTTVRQDS